MLRAAATEIVERLRHAGYEALFAGGCVRDRLLGTEPADYDIVTSARPHEVEGLFKNTIPVGRQFGIVVVPQNDHGFEVATFRSDGCYLDGRRPASVTFSDAEHDSRRRDFTINAMFEDPLTGELIDYNGGRADLEAGLIRTVGLAQDRFSEDRLRLLRAVRFAARLGFRIEERTYEALREQARYINEVSVERVTAELARILTEGHARRGFELLDEVGLLGPILPELLPMKGCEQDAEFHPEGDVFVHTMACLERLPAGCTLTLALGVLLHDVAKPACHESIDGRHLFHGHTREGGVMAEAICRRLRVSNAVTARVRFLVEQHLRHCSAPDMKASTLKRFLGQDGIEELLALVRIDTESSSGSLDDYELCVQALDDMPPEQIRPLRLVSGNDLIALGLSPGPRFKVLLAAVEEAQLEGEVTTREQGLALLARLVADGPDGS
ncbi:MAG: CCA tRNA nucleotidyltransferase [Candidatus Binatia bacterium]